MFSDQRFDGAGVSLADPASSGMPGLMRGDFGVYSVVEQKLYRVGADDDRGIGVFARASYSPPDRNLIDYYADTGLEFVGLADGRPKDKFGIAAAYAHVSPRAQALDLDFQRLTDARLARAQFRRSGHCRLPVRGAGRMDPSAELSVHRAPRRRRHKPALRPSRQGLEKCGGVRPSNRAEILARLVAADVTGAAFTRR